jgi:hypothetical protein
VPVIGPRAYIEQPLDFLPLFLMTPHVASMAPGDALLAGRSCRPRKPLDDACLTAFLTAAMRTTTATADILEFTSAEVLTEAFHRIVGRPWECPPGYVSMLSLMATGT